MFFSDKKLGWVKELLALADSACKLLRIREPEKLKQDFEREAQEFVSKGFKITEREDRKIEFESGDESIGKIRKKIIHGPKLEKIYGADLVIEFPGERVVLIQCKLQSKQGRFTIPRHQLWAMLKVCQMLCKFRCYSSCILYPKIHFCTVPEQVCPGSTFYELDDGSRSTYLRSCDLSFVLGSRTSVSAREICGLSEEEFRAKLFRGEVGCEDLPRREKGEILAFYSELTNRIVYLLEVIT